MDRDKIIHGRTEISFLKIFTYHSSLANRHSCLTPDSNEGIDIDNVGPTEVYKSSLGPISRRYFLLSIGWSA